MGRREDGAAVREGRRCAPSSPGRRHRETRPPADAAPRVEANVAFHSRAMAGLRSQAIGPAARSWLTGVAGPRSRKRGPPVARTPHVERREAPSSDRKEEGDAFAKRPTGWSRQPPIGGLASPRVCRRSAPLEGSAMWKMTRACPGPTQEYGRRSVGCWKCESEKRSHAALLPSSRGANEASLEGPVNATKARIETRRPSRLGADASSSHMATGSARSSLTAY
jgi:hypothetical protein